MKRLSIFILVMAGPFGFTYFPVAQSLRYLAERG